MDGTWTVAALLSGLLLAAALPDKMPFTTVASGGGSNVDRARQVIVRTASEWKALCAQHAPGETCPAVDFSRSTVVGVFLGSRPSAGYSVEITEITRDGQALVVTYREQRPGPNDMAAQMMTAPFQIATIDRFPGEIRFVRAR